MYLAVLGDAGVRLGPAPFEQGRLWLLPERGLVVVREHRQPGGWRCSVIAGRSAATRTGERWHADVTDAEWSAGSGVVVVDPATDPDGAVMLWLVRVWQYWPGRRIYLLARALVDGFRQPGKLELDLSPAAMLRLAQGYRMRPDLVRRVVDRLIRDGFLTPTGTARGGQVLCLPHGCGYPLSWTDVA